MLESGKYLLKPGSRSYGRDDRRAFGGMPFPRYTRVRHCTRSATTDCAAYQSDLTNGDGEPVANYLSEPQTQET